MPTPQEVTRKPRGSHLISGARRLMLLGAPIGITGFAGVAATNSPEALIVMTVAVVFVAGVLMLMAAIVLPEAWDRMIDATLVIADNHERKGRVQGEVRGLGKLTVSFEPAQRQPKCSAHAARVQKRRRPLTSPARAGDEHPSCKARRRLSSTLHAACFRGRRSNGTGHCAR